MTERSLFVFMLKRYLFIRDHGVFSLNRVFFMEKHRVDGISVVGALSLTHRVVVGSSSSRVCLDFAGSLFRPV